MRLKIVFDVKEDIGLPLHYNHIIQKNIYDILEPVYSKFLHEEGYKYKKRNFKLFTFSKLVIPNKKVMKDIINIKKGKVFLTISTIDERFIFAFINGIINRRYFNFREGKMDIEKVYARKDFKRRKIVGLTISPVVLKKYIENGQDIFYDIKDPLFTEKMKENLLKKYKAYYNHDYKGNLEVKILDYKKTKKVVDFYKKYPYEGFLGGFIIIGNPEIIDIAYSCGLGNKNSQGFGCIELINEINKWDNYIRVL
ncbi:CRISPR-associated endoribonuclease Cas6 [Defluviitalea phaphyphila]|uniref:CRISPR-associated endoribonuclease Cas6 n=1 Tax=Defluviitalea phaphyphila TaxID=1473580 RepID=UPI00073183E3|nr:CRISPR-associated endoribonuclease Cas6 [Defluviitalea phaphyphila]